MSIFGRNFKDERDDERDSTAAIKHETNHDRETSISLSELQSIGRLTDYQSSSSKHERN